MGFTARPGLMGFTARPGLILAAALALAAAPVHVAVAAEAPATEAVLRASLAIDTNAAGPAGPIIHERLDELGNRQLRRAEVLPGRGARDPWIRVTVRALPGEEPGYIISSGLFVEEQPVADSAHETECRLCTEGEAVERGTAEIERLVPFVRDHAEARRKQAAAAAAVPPPEPPKDEPPKKQPLGTRGKAGIALLAVGAVGFGAGLGLAIKQPGPDPDDPLREVTTRPAGYATLGIGVAALIAGAVLLALDRKPPPRRVSWTPQVGRGGAGLLLSGSF
jgi:hypothetical protein